ncbi:hypothetical protein A1O1_04952 [Capronia coronata CBS 617.96]|uniref:Uncharacterized protein n=1 Tax=Capronia coronata CBS 617.96 TaxID=1182541 RepID=W9YED4_9EURO|nr:uncharacterized protein A1O1_04952 [Capronia coronata CBS 617.96]EXJ88025.1 hypothetical protein A1O1_04952 [Capronia coronata CBS 617.96]
MADTPEKRPQHALYEGAVPVILCFNPMLPFLARLLVHGAFRDYDTIEELFGIIPPDDEMLQLHWKDEVLDTPFFKAQSSKSSTDRIETADAFSKRNRALGLRAGHSKPPTGHDFRAEGLYWIDKFYSEATRMVHAGHMDSNTLRRHYMPTNGADGQGTYLGGKGRTIVADLFRGLTLPRNPNLSQCLPAEKQWELENTPQYLALSEEITNLEGKTDTKSVNRRRRLYSERRTLTDKELRDWQKRQPNRPNDPAGYYRAIFNRVSFLMPERKSLSENLFEIDTLRSPMGLSTLRAMMTLYRQQSEVEYRPGLEPDKCCCSKVYENEIEENRPAFYDWMHIYACYKRSCESVYGSVELCFLCNEWVFGEISWEKHCHQHLARIQDLPTFCDPLIYGRVLATAGYCPFCLTDERLPASVRLKQFLNRGKWLTHIHKHISSLDVKEPLKCAHP